MRPIRSSAIDGHWYNSRTGARTGARTEGRNGLMPHEAADSIVDGVVDGMSRAGRRPACIART